MCRILRSYACYYNDIRTHRSLDKDAPIERSKTFLTDIGYQAPPRAVDMPRALSASEAAAVDVRNAGGKKTSANILGDGGAVVGSWTFTPQAAT